MAGFSTARGHRSFQVELSRVLILGRRRVMHAHDRPLIETEHIILLVAQLRIVGGVYGRCGACRGGRGGDHLGGVLVCTASGFDS